MKRIPWFGLLGLLTLLQSGLWGLGIIYAQSEKYELTVPPKIIIEVTPEQLGAIPPGGKLERYITFNAQVCVPGQGNEGNKYILSWQIEPSSGIDQHIPNGKVYCKIGNSTNAFEGTGDQNFASQLFYEIPGNTPPGEYRYRVTFTVGMGAQGQGVKCKETIEIIIKIPGFVRLWAEPCRVDLIHVGPDNIGSKEDLVRVYISCNVPWKLKYRISDPSVQAPIEAKIDGTSEGVSGLINQWSTVPKNRVELAMGPPTGRSWVLLRLRSNPKCSLTTGSYPFELGFELEAR